MRSIAKLSAQDRKELFSSTAFQTGMSEAIIEKDFWVCWMLDYLFHRCRWKSHLAFKGGTSLSKAYDLIQRFSEDIDLILDWQELGYEKDEPWKMTSNKKRDGFCTQIKRKTATFLRDECLPVMKYDLEQELGRELDIHVDPNDQQTIVFVYPQSFRDAAILQEIRLEIGALAAWTPVSVQMIGAYSAQQFPQIFTQSTTSVLTLDPERTFWEKVVILHMISNWPEGKRIPDRYSRHYYDLYCMFSSEIKDKACADLDLLERVVDFKDRFYHSSKAGYDHAKAGTLQLLPSKENEAVLRKDYENMKEMIYGEKPDFSIILDTIRRLETEINASHN